MGFFRAMRCDLTHMRKNVAAEDSELVYLGSGECYKTRAMRSTFLALLLCGCSVVSWSQVVLQALPPDTPENCASRSKTMYQWLEDWPNMARYAEADKQAETLPPNQRTVVFMGDSITDGWNVAKYFPGMLYVNRGISAQTTPQMLLRFRPDVINLKPKVVVILAGTNDIAGNTGPLTLAEIEDNYASMADLARANHIAVVFSSVTPVSNYVPEKIRFFNERPMDEIKQLNVWLQKYTREHGDVYLDYYSHMVDERGMLKKEISDDGLHPNDAGYRIMAPLAEKAIAKAMAKKR
jgi:lysophospholipase L1-like esterase